MATKSRSELRTFRHKRIRKRIEGTATRPRLSVYRSSKHVSAQLIDDVAGTTLVAASSQEKSLKAACNVEGAKVIGKTLAERAKAKGVKSVVFDRGGYQYHGVVAALADGAREAGLEF